MNAPVPLVLVAVERPEIGGDTNRTLVDRFSDHADTVTDRYVQVRWMNDRSGRWSKTKSISLGKTGQTIIDRAIAPMGIYVSRQYEVVLSDPVKFILCGMEEQIVGLV